MNGDPLERLARRQTVRRALAFTGISAAIVLSVIVRAQTAPAPVSALSSRELAKPVGGSAASAAPASEGPGPSVPSTAAAPTRRHVRSTTTPPRKAGTPRHTTPPAQPTTPPPATHTTVPAPTTTRVLTGSAYDVGYGVVQVRVTVRGSSILDVTAVSMPQGGHSGDITAMAEPQLRREAISAQSAGINAVSGATYTSSGYAKSLQSALDKAAA